MKTIVLYDSRTGHTKQMAETIAAGMEKVDGVQAKACSITEMDVAWAQESKCIVLGAPIYFATISAAMKTFLEGPFLKSRPVGKLGGAFATANYVHGGGDLGIRLMLDHMMVCGMLTYSGGGAFGKPVVHIGPVAIAENLQDYAGTFETYGERMARKAVELFGV